MNENCEAIGNYTWIVDTPGSGQRKVIAKNHSVDNHGNLYFVSYLPCGCVMTADTFAAGKWTNVMLLKPELVALEQS